VELHKNDLGLHEVSFSIKLAAFQASGGARMKLCAAKQRTAEYRRMESLAQRRRLRRVVLGLLIQ